VLEKIIPVLFVVIEMNVRAKGLSLVCCALYLSASQSPSEHVRTTTAIL
jgi:hypothetical protein